MPYYVILYNCCTNLKLNFLITGTKIMGQKSQEILVICILSDDFHFGEENPIKEKHK